ncbi:MAG: transposase [Lachnospiraceae bacterium]
MPRKPRKWYKGDCYHLMGRGNRRTALFKSDSDYRVFLMQLEQVRERYAFELHAYCLMTNHSHLEITTMDTPEWKIMKPVMQNYAMWFNKKYGYEGHVFDSRYTSRLIENNLYFLEVSRYIHLNPVKAQMVREPLAYDYSSYKIYMSEEPEESIPGIVDTRKVFELFQHTPREQYRMFVEGKISHAEQEMMIQKDMKEDDMWLPW